LSASIQLLFGIGLGEGRWNLLMAARLLSAGGVAVVVVVLWLLDVLTVDAVAVTYITVGILANVPLLVVLRRSWPWTFVAPVARAGLAFGIRSWLTALSSTGITWLDQLLMAGLVSSRQLGLYALAVTLSNASSSLIGATTNALVPRVAAGDAHLAARACRVTLMLATIPAVSIAVVSPLGVPFVFGKAFTDAIPMLVVLLGANLFSVPSQVLASALIAAGNPSATARASSVGFALTVPALIIVLPLAGGLGAAWVSLAVYVVTFAIVIRAARHTFVLPYRAFLIVTRTDLSWLRGALRRRETPRNAPDTV
jgi:O-antigen/teichoic acid export membrane protein